MWVADIGTHGPTSVKSQRFQRLSYDQSRQDPRASVKPVIGYDPEIEHERRPSVVRSGSHERRLRTTAPAARPAVILGGNVG